MLREGRVAVRTLVQRRALTTAVVVTLALSIGGANAIYAALDAVVLRPLPYPGPDRLVAVFEVNSRQPQTTSLVAAVRIDEWNQLARSFDGIAGSYFENVTDTTGHVPERVAVMRTSPNFFAVLRSAAALGLYLYRR